MEYVHVDCYNCKSNKNTLYASENGFNLVKCNGCGLLFVNPRPSDNMIAEAHKLGVHQGIEKLGMTGTFDNTKISNYLKILEDIFGQQINFKGKVWLDIGCGHGEFMAAIKKFSNDEIIVKGIEPNISKQKSAQKRGLDASFFDLGKHACKYDFISFLNVYSHLPNPLESLLSWQHLLKPGGKLLLETGNTANLNSKDHYKPFLLPDHLSFASESIVVDILKKSGFETINIKKYPFIKCNLKSITKEIIKLLLPNKKSLLKYIIKHKKYADTDMYIQATLKI